MEIMRQNIVSIHKIPSCLLEFSSSPHHLACDNTDVIYHYYFAIPRMSDTLFYMHMVCCYVTSFT